jgi:hypothetical protein
VAPSTHRRTGTSTPTPAPALRTVHLSLAGEHVNVGDGIIRRRTLDWVRGAREVHVYVGSSSAQSIAQLQLDPGARVYRREQHSAWVRGALRGGRRSLVLLAPGEVQLRGRELPRELKMLALTAVVRLAGGAVVRAPRAVRAHAWPTLVVHRLAAALSTSAMWRDRRSAELVGVGEDRPDIGFSERMSSGMPWEHRSVLGVSLRGPRPAPSEEWVEGVRAFADRAGLRIQTFAQVKLDERRAAELAERLGGEHLPWAGDRDLLAQERYLRQVYGGARVVVSDRLHVLVVALLCGAVVAEVADAPTSKVSDHFAQIGVDRISYDVRTRGAPGVAAFLEGQVARRQEVLDHLAAARAELAEVERMVQGLLAR